MLLWCVIFDPTVGVVLILNVSFVEIVGSELFGALLHPLVLVLLLLTLLLLLLVVLL